MAGEKEPSVWIVHSVFLLAQSAYGGGNVVVRITLESTNVFLFALIRGLISLPFLGTMAYVRRVRFPARADLKEFAITSLCWGGSQVTVQLGLHLTSAVLGSTWQCGAPVMAAIFGYMLGLERLSCLKVWGITGAVGGAVFLIVFGAALERGNPIIYFVGNFCFFINVSCTALYIIWARKLLDKKYSAVGVAAWCTLFSIIPIAFATIIVSSFKPLWKFFCATCSSPWSFPPTSWIPVSYWGIICSVFCFFGISWGNKFADASINLSYIVLQPLTAAVLATILLATGVVRECKFSGDEKCLYSLSWNALGAIGIVGGLAVIIYTDYASRKLSESVKDGVEMGEMR